MVVREIRWWYLFRIDFHLLLNGMDSWNELGLIETMAGNSVLFSSINNAFIQFVGGEKQIFGKKCGSLQYLSGH